MVSRPPLLLLLISAIPAPILLLSIYQDFRSSGIAYQVVLSITHTHSCICAVNSDCEYANPHLCLTYALTVFLLFKLTVHTFTEVD